MKFRCVDCNVETRCVLNLKLMSAAMDSVNNKQEPSREAKSAVQSYNDYTSFASPHRDHKSYAVTITIQEKSQIL